MRLLKPLLLRDAGGPVARSQADGNARRLDLDLSRAEVGAMSSTVDPGEIAKFEALAAQWWDPNGPFAALHRMNPLRLGLIRDAARELWGQERPLKGKTAIDLGCGGGLVTAPLARMGAQALGVDGAEEAVAAARTYAQGAGLNVRFEVSTAEAEAARTPGAYDLVTALEIVEHVADVGAFLRAAAALLKPGGLLCVSTINRTPQARALALFAAEKVLHMAPDGAHEFEKLVTPAELETVDGLDWRAPIGMSFNPVARTWAASGDVSMNYFRAAVKR